MPIRGYARVLLLYGLVTVLQDPICRAGTASGRDPETGTGRRAAINYDSVDVLKSFADRQHITYPLLSDPDSKVIRAYDILNETTKPGTPTYGIPYPGVYVVDTQGRVVSKYFEDDYKDRVATANILARHFGTALDEARGAAETKHLQITTAASHGMEMPGLRGALSLDIELKSGLHVYAPGVHGYIPIDWRLGGGGPAAKRHGFEYPASEMLRLEAVRETVSVYQSYSDPSRDHLWTGSCFKAPGHCKGRSDRQGIVPLPGVRRSQVLCS